GCASFVAIHGEHAQDRIEAVTFGDELTNLRCLEVSDRNVLRALRPLETRIEIRHLEPTAFTERADKEWIPIVAPTRPRASFFVNRESFRKPARNTIVSHLQRNDVSVLVPQCAAPIKLAGFARGRRILRDHETKTYAERAQAGNAKRAHREVFVVIKDLDNDRALRRELVLRSK